MENEIQIDASPENLQAAIDSYVEARRLSPEEFFEEDEFEEPEEEEESEDIPDVYEMSSLELISELEDDPYDRFEEILETLTHRRDDYIEGVVENFEGEFFGNEVLDERVENDTFTVDLASALREGMYADHRSTHEFMGSVGEDTLAREIGYYLLADRPRTIFHGGIITSFPRSLYRTDNGELYDDVAWLLGYEITKAIKERFAFGGSTTLARLPDKYQAQKDIAIKYCLELNLDPDYVPAGSILTNREETSEDEIRKNIIKYYRQTDSHVTVDYKNVWGEHCSQQASALANAMRDNINKMRTLTDYQYHLATAPSRRIPIEIKSSSFIRHYIAQGCLILEIKDPIIITHKLEKLGVDLALNLGVWCIALDYLNTNLLAFPLCAIKSDIHKPRVGEPDLFDTPSSYFHPHVSTQGDICFGNMQDEYASALRSKDWTKAVELAETALREFHSGNPFIQLDQLISKNPPNLKWVIDNGKFLDKSQRRQV